MRQVSTEECPAPPDSPGDAAVPASRGGTPSGQVRDRSLSWHDEMKLAFRDLPSLAQYLELPSDWLAASAHSPETSGFPLFAPYPYVDRIRRGDPSDPLLRQILPVAEERAAVPGFSADPVGDLSHQLTPGVIHKYRGRALLIASGACAIHCRYCFRRHFPYAATPHSLAQWQPALESLAAIPDLEEVILSGGDPLTLRDELLAELMFKLRTLVKLKRIRIHTRLPIVIPQRVTEPLLELLSGYPAKLVVVIHVNHAREIDGPVAAGLQRLRDAGVLLLNQAVLLRGVNDTVECLAALSDRLIAVGVVPYYLHQLDRVAGAAHFEVPMSEGRRLVRQLAARLPGFAVPRYVHDEPGGASKRWLS